MANNTVQGGLTPVRTLTGDLTGIGNEYEILAANGTATFVGDPMQAQNTSSAVDGCPDVIQWATGANLLLGSLRSVKPVLTNLTLQYRVASTLQRCYVEDNPLVVFHIQSSGTTASADVMKYATMVINAGSTTTGQSAVTLNEASVTGTGTTSLPLKIIRQQPAIGNPINAASGVYEVIIVNHTLLQQSSQNSLI